jgi:subtilisin-like proprotein convertase family protein
MIQSSPLVRLDELRSSQQFAGIDGSGFSVVIVDTGIDLDHPFFGADANGDGISDRIVYSYDFSGANDSDASDHSGHGSNVSSIVASSDSQLTGMAPGANIIHLKVFPDAGGGATGRDIEEALQWVVAHAGEYNIASVNLSLGYGNFAYVRNNTSWADEFAALESLNVITVAAAGNSYYSLDSDTGVSAPAADPAVIAVGAVFDRNIGRVSYGSGATAQTSGPDVITPFSQRHPFLVDVFAPGAPITGAGPRGGLLTQHGTSQATPHVAGAAALAQQLAVQELGRRLTVDEFRHLLSTSSATIHDGDDENDNVDNTHIDYPRLDLVTLASGILQLRPGSIEGRLFFDLDRDGLAGEEPGLGSQLVYLDANDNGQLDAGSVTFVSPAGDMPIEDQSMLRSEILVDQPLGPLTDINVEINLEHSWNADLAIYVVSPSGSRIELVSGVGNGHANFLNTAFDDEAGTSISQGTPPYQGSFRPSEPLWKLDSEQAMGSWILEVHDRLAQDQGVLHGWTLTLAHAERSTSSAEDGRFVLAGLPAGSHLVRTVVSPSWVLTSPDPASGGAHLLNVVAGESTSGVHFGHQTSLQVQVADEMILENAGAGATLLQVSRQGTSTAEELLVMLTHDDPSEIVLPSQVIIPAGLNSVVVPLDAVDDQLRDGSQHVTITAAAAGIGTGMTSIEVADHEQLTVVVEPTAIHENAGSQAVRLVVYRSDVDTHQPVEVQLSSSDTSELVVPVLLTIPAESISAEVMIDVVDDQLLDGLQFVQVTAAAAGFYPGITTVEVRDHEPLGIMLAEHVAWVSEAVGENTLTINRTDAAHGQSLVVQLSWQGIEGIVAPDQLTIPAGLTAASTTIHVTDPASWQGQQQVVVIASATGHEDATASFFFSDRTGLHLDPDRLSVAENAGLAAVHWTLTRVGGDFAADLVVSLASSDTTELAVPGSIVIPAQQATVTFTADAVDDHLRDGSQQVLVTASADSFQDVATTIEVSDYETWQNPVNPFDVDHNGHVSPADVLHVISRLQRDGPLPLPINPDSANATIPFLDINGDLQLSEQDVSAFLVHFNEVSLAILKARAAAASQQVVAKLDSSGGLVQFSRSLVASISRPQQFISTARDLPGRREPAGPALQPVIVEQQVMPRGDCPPQSQPMQRRLEDEMMESWKWEWGELEEILDLVVAGQLD